MCSRWLRPIASKKQVKCNCRPEPQAKDLHHHEVQTLRRELRATIPELESMKRYLIAILLCLAPRFLLAQERGAVVLGEAVAGLDVTTRVLMIGAHPDDED